MSLPTTTVGSFPKSPALRRARWKHAECEIDDAALREFENRDMAHVLEIQEELGLDLWVDGQLDRGDMVSYFAGRLEGLEEGQLVRCYGNRYYRRPRVIGDIERLAAITVERWHAAHSRASRPVKAVITGPYTLMSWSFDEHYRDRERCCFAFAHAVQQEAEDLLAAGAKEIQIDEPAISSRPEEMGMAFEAMRRVTRNLKEARVWAHLSYGDFAPVIDAIFDLPVDGLMLELANSRFELLEQLPALPGDKLLAAGVIDVLDPEVESVATVASRIESVLAKVPAERLWLAPDAGLKTLSEEQARGKLDALVQAAASV